MIKGNKVYLTRDLHTSYNGSPVVSGAVLSEKPLLYCLINFSHARKQVYKNFFEMLYTLFPALLLFYNFRELLLLAL